MRWSPVKLRYSGVAGDAKLVGHKAVVTRAFDRKARCSLVHLPVEGVKIERRDMMMTRHAHGVKDVRAEVNGNPDAIVQHNCT